MRSEVSRADSEVLEGVWRILRVLAPYGIACSQTDAAGLASLEQGTNETISTGGTCLVLPSSAGAGVSLRSVFQRRKRTQFVC